jgi:hypothetical protein
VHAREDFGLGTIPIIVLFSIPRGSLHIPSLVGRIIRLTAQRLCLPHRESHSRQKIYCIVSDEGQMTCRFPNPIPSGTRVPQWALIDITVCCYVFLLWQRIHNIFQSENLWDLDKAIAVGGENPLPVFLSRSMSQTHILFSRLPRTNSWHKTRYTEKQFKHGHHRRQRCGWRGSNFLCYRDRLLSAAAPSRGAGPRRFAGCW